MDFLGVKQNSSDNDLYLGSIVGSFYGLQTGVLNYLNIDYLYTVISGSFIYLL